MKSINEIERILKEKSSRQIGNVQHVRETCKEDQLLQQERVDLKNSFLFQEKRRLYIEYLGKDRSTWPDVKQTNEKLKANREERIVVKNNLEEEKDKIYNILQKAREEHDSLQEKNRKLEEKLHMFESKLKLFESRQKLDQESATAAILKCEQTIAKIESEVLRLRGELQEREMEIGRLKMELRGRGKSPGTQDQSVERLNRVIKLIQDLSGVEVHVTGQEQLTLEFISNNHELMAVTSPEESLNLEMTLTFSGGCHGNVKLTDVKISVDHFQITDLIDTAIALNDVPYLVLSVQERWNQHFPLLSEMDILNKTHAVDWIQEQCRLRVLVGKCGKIMFTLSVPKDYPSTREITLLDSYGIDEVDKDDLPARDSTLLQWVFYLERKYGDC